MHSIFGSDFQDVPSGRNFWIGEELWKVRSGHDVRRLGSLFQVLFGRLFVGAWKAGP